MIAAYRRWQYECRSGVLRNGVADHGSESSPLNQCSKCFQACQGSWAKIPPSSLNARAIISANTTSYSGFACLHAGSRDRHLPREREKPDTSCAAALIAHQRSPAFTSSSSGRALRARCRNFISPAPVAFPARFWKNCAAVSTTATFSATATAIYWFRDTPSSLARRWAAFLIDTGSFKG